MISICKQSTSPHLASNQLVAPEHLEVEVVHQVVSLAGAQEHWLVLAVHWLVVHWHLTVGHWHDLGVVWQAVVAQVDLQLIHWAVEPSPWHPQVHVGQIQVEPSWPRMQEVLCTCLWHLHLWRASPAQVWLLHWAELLVLQVQVVPGAETLLFCHQPPAQEHWALTALALPWPQSDFHWHHSCHQVESQEVEMGGSPGPPSCSCPLCQLQSSSPHPLALDHHHRLQQHHLGEPASHDEVSAKSSSVSGNNLPRNGHGSCSAKQK